MQRAEHAEEGSWAGAELRDPPEMLAGFVKYLEEIGAAELLVEDRLDPGDGWGFDDEAVDNRARIQGCAMIGNRLGLGAPYSRDYFPCGPKSGQLARDLVALSGRRAGLYDGAPAAVPASFDGERFEALVRGRDTDWIIGASSTVELEGLRSNRECLADSLAGRRRPRGAVMEAIAAVEKAGIVGPIGRRPAAVPRRRAGDHSALPATFVLWLLPPRRPLRQPGAALRRMPVEGARQNPPPHAGRQWRSGPSGRRAPTIGSLRRRETWKSPCPL